MICPNCNSKHLEKESDIVLCNDCGFHTTKLYEDLSSDFPNSIKTEFDSFLISMPKIVQDLRVEDDGHRYWLPIIVHIDNIGTLTIDGTSKTEYKWCIYWQKPIPIFERLNYPVDGKKDEYHEFRLEPEYFNSFQEAKTKFEK